jgi:hypothetical protein
LDLSDGAARGGRKRAGGRDDVAIRAHQVRARSHEVAIAFADLGLAVEEKVDVVTRQPLVKR